MHADEVEIDVALVRRLVATQFPGWAALPVEPVPSAGTDNALFRLGDELVARLPRLEARGATLDHERRWLRRLAASLPLAIPVPVAEGRPAEGYPFTWSVYRWLDGDDATVAAVRDEALLASDVAGFVSALQAVDPAGGPPPGAHNFYRGAPLAVRDAATRAAIDALRGEIDARAITDVWDNALAERAWDHMPVWIHGDLDARNLLIVGGRLSAVIDWGAVGVGDPACDVMVAWKLFEAPAREAFRTDLGADDATWTRARGWVVSQAVVALASYTDETNPVLVREARRWLVEALGDS